MVNQDNELVLTTDQPASRMVRGNPGKGLDGTRAPRSRKSVHKPAFILGVLQKSVSIPELRALFRVRYDLAMQGDGQAFRDVMTVFGIGRPELVVAILGNQDQANSAIAAVESLYVGNLVPKEHDPYAAIDSTARVEDTGAHETAG